jgi:hypothetical protein
MNTNWPHLGSITTKLQNTEKHWWLERNYTQDTKSAIFFFLGGGGEIKTCSVIAVYNTTLIYKDCLTKVLRYPRWTVKKLYILCNQIQEFVAQYRARTQWWLMSTEYLECCVAYRTLLLHCTPNIKQSHIPADCWAVLILTFVKFVTFYRLILNCINFFICHVFSMLLMLV